MSKVIDMTNWDMREHGVPNSYIYVIGGYKRRNNHSYWTCECMNCGKIFEAEGYAIRTGQTRSCGCHYNKDDRELTGKVFGKLTVLEEDKDYVAKNNIVQHLKYWKCMCECGNIITTTGHNLRTKHTLSCGCQSHNVKRQQNADKYIGKKYGLLTVIRQITISKTGGAPLWEFRCDCGRIKYSDLNNVTSGKVGTCGLCRTSSSIGERIIYDLLTENNIDFHYNTNGDTGLLSANNTFLRWDFILFQNNQIVRFIEFDGEQHYHPCEFFGGETGFNELSSNDKIKNHYALSHNIPLVRIPYWQRNNITLDMLLGDEYIVKEE